MIDLNIIEVGDAPINVLYFKVSDVTALIDTVRGAYGEPQLTDYTVRMLYDSLPADGVYCSDNELFVSYKQVLLLISVEADAVVAAVCYGLSLATVRHASDVSDNVTLGVVTLLLEDILYGK